LVTPVPGIDRCTLKDLSGYAEFETKFETCEGKGQFSGRYYLSD
jgi:hypothetical protein